MNLRICASLLLLMELTAFYAQGKTGDIVGICVTHYYNVAGGDTPLGKPVQAKLNTIMLDGFDFKNEDIANVLNDLSELSKRLDSEKVGVKIQLDLSGPLSSKFFPVRRNVNLKVTDEMCLAEVLAYICEETNLGYRIVDGVVVMEPM